MNVIQARFQSPVYPDNVEGLIEHITERVSREFYRGLDEALKNAPGGLIVGQPHVERKVEDDWLFKTGDYVTLRMWAHVEELPLPPEYRLIGGPADGHIVRTQGQRVWLVPVMPPPPSAASYADPLKEPPYLIAEYERQGDTSAYFYKRTYER